MFYLSRYTTTYVAIEIRLTDGANFDIVELEASTSIRHPAHRSSRQSISYVAIVYFGDDLLPTGKLVPSSLPNFTAFLRTFVLGKCVKFYASRSINDECIIKSCGTPTFAWDTVTATLYKLF